MALRNLLSGVEAAEDGNFKPKLMKPSNLDVYWEPDEPVYATTSNQESALLKQVRKGRQFIWQFSGGASSAYTNATQSISKTAAAVENAYDSAVKDPLTLIQPASISAAVFVGALLPGRGRRPFMRLFGASVLGTTATAVSYPKKASEVSISAFHKGKDWGSCLVVSAKKAWEGKPKVITQEIPELIGKEEVDVTGKDEVDVTLQLDVPSDASLAVENNEKPVLSEDLASNEIMSVVVEPEGTKALLLANKEESKEEVKEEVKEEMKEEGKEETAHLEQLESQYNDLKGHSDITELPKQDGNILKDFGQSDPEDKDMYSTRE